MDACEGNDDFERISAPLRVVIWVLATTGGLVCCVCLVNNLRSTDASLDSPDSRASLASLWCDSLSSDSSEGALFCGCGCGIIIVVTLMFLPLVVGIVAISTANDIQTTTCTHDVNVVDTGFDAGSFAGGEITDDDGSPLMTQQQWLELEVAESWRDFVDTTKVSQSSTRSDNLCFL